MVVVDTELTDWPIWSLRSPTFVPGRSPLPGSGMPSVIDGHTHVFNVGFLPVEGILLSYKRWEWLTTPATLLLECLLERERKENLAPDEEQFYSLLQNELRGSSDPQVCLESDEWFARYVDAIPAARIAELRNILPSEIEIRMEADIVARVRPRTGSLTEDTDADVRRRAELVLRQADELGPVETGGDKALHDKALHSPSLRGIMKWLSMLVQHETRLAEAFPGAWQGETFLAQVDMMMDMKLHYTQYGGRPPVYDFETEQLKRMLAVQKHVKHPLVMLTAFDPFKPTGLAIVKRAIADGFAGVKFYPPNGYKPIDNEPDDIVNGPTAAEVNQRNLDFFQWCAATSNDIPIFAHCTPHGVESRREETGEFSNPCHWRTVLSRPELSKLRLCLGHAGGEEAWTARFDAAGDKLWNGSYAKDVVELCCRFDNVYCDFGYFETLLDGKGPALAARLEWVFNANPGFAKKCCYGTDWHLMIVRKRARNYPALFRDMLKSKLVLQASIDDFMFGNVKRFLKM